MCHDSFLVLSTPYSPYFICQATWLCHDTQQDLSLLEIKQRRLFLLLPIEKRDIISSVWSATWNSSLLSVFMGLLNKEKETQALPIMLQCQLLTPSLSQEWHWRDPVSELCWFQSIIWLRDLCYMLLLLWNTSTWSFPHNNLIKRRKKYSWITNIPDTRGNLMNAVCESTTTDRQVSLSQRGEFQCRRHMKDIVKKYLRPFQRESRGLLPS